MQHQESQDEMEMHIQETFCFPEGDYAACAVVNQLQFKLFEKVKIFEMCK